MRIVHLIDYFQPKLGYQEYFLAREHQKLGHEVYVLTSDRYYNFANFDAIYGKILGTRIVGYGEKVEEGIRTVRLRTIEIPNSPLLVLLDIKNKLNKIKPDAVFCHGVYSITSFFAALYISRVKYKLIYDSHASYFNTNFDDSFPKKIYHLFYKHLVVPKILNNAGCFFAIGEEEQRFLADDFGLPISNIPIIRLGVDVNRFCFLPKEREEVRNKLRFDKGDTVLLYAGKITPNKDVEILFRAVNLLNKQKIKFLIIGGGDMDYIANLRKILPGDQRVVFIDFVQNKELPSYFSAADIGVWPGDPSNAMLEAMACSLPLVLPYGDQTKYLDKSSGVVRFDRGDWRGLATILKKIVKKPKLLKKLSQNNRNYAKKELSWSKIAKESLELVKN